MMVDAATADGTAGDPARVLGAVMAREEQGSTFLNEGVAFPHARLEGLERPVVVVGLTHGGIPDVSTEKPVGIVFLILTPPSDPDAQVRLLGLFSRAARNRELVRRLQAARSGDEALAAILDWEATTGV